MWIDETPRRVEGAETTAGGSPRGLGSLISSMLNRIGIKKKPGCGCQKRADTLDRLFPFKR